ncbi:MAG: o-succinylbenzoate synthase [Sphingobacterium sp.]|nr:o-succinylbenzoate synthase [Sphingobacterium sp.]
MPEARSPAVALEALTVPKIDRLDFVTVKLPFVAPFGTSVYTWTDKEALLLRLESGGVTAWSECVSDPDPFYFYETNGTVRHIVRDFLLPLVEPGITLGELDARFRRVRGHGMAKATVENGLLILIALRNGVPLHELMGRPARKIMSGLSIGLKETPEELLAAVEQAVARKYGRVKMKVKKGQDIDWVRAVRDRFPGLPLMVDANGDYTLADTAHLRRLDEFGLMMVEQPLSYSDIYEHSLLQKEMKTPICLDESIHGLADAAAAIALGACRIVNIKQGRVGGLMESMRIAAYCAAHGVGVWSGGMDETGIGRAVNIHLQTAAGFTLPGDTSETANYFDEDIADPPVVLDAEGFIDIPGGPGLGVRDRPRAHPEAGAALGTSALTAGRRTTSSVARRDPIRFAAARPFVEQCPHGRSQDHHRRLFGALLLAGTADARGAGDGAAGKTAQTGPAGLRSVELCRARGCRDGRHGPDAR